MYAVQNVFLRVFIVLGMGAAVVTILYFTPIPDKIYLNCNRPCHDLDWPMICRVKLTLENYKALQKYHWHSNNCSIQDEISTSINAVNRQLPGPPIQVCQNDVLVVDVINKIPGQSVTIHWRGQPQNEAPMMDGVPMVTQCPISSYTTFQYKFRASTPGTHLWHAHAGAKFSAGIFGALIVKEAEKKDPFKDLYDYDDITQMLIISERTVEFSVDSARLLLINGKTTPEENIFHLSWGKRYRFRMMYSGGSVSCPVTVSIEKHLVTVIALDGNAIKPYEVAAMTYSKGERVDFILKADQAHNSYALKVTSECSDSVLKTEAIIKYSGFEDKRIAYHHKSVQKKEGHLSTNRRLDTAACETGLNNFCIMDVQSLENIPSALTKNVDKTLHLGFDYKIVNPINDTGSEELPQKVYRMNNITFTYPSSPLFTQREDVTKASICNSLNKPMQCREIDICECVHIETVPLGASVELIFADLGDDSLETVFHVHGYQFYVVGQKQFKKPIYLDNLKKLEEQGVLMKRNFNKPVKKDTVRVPKHGVVAVRFIASNPGYWMIRDEHSDQWTRGMDVVLQVGDSCDMVSKPKNFPLCGSWTGPEFFLI